jgi:CheY-like chemotaxis protein
MRILLADDQNEIRLLTTQQLQQSGHHVVAVANGQEVLDALEREPFDIVLLDEEMLIMNGLQALRAIREGEKEPGRRTLIALTGYNTEPDRERLLKAGFNSVIRKPFHLEALESLFTESRGKTPAKEPNEAPSVLVQTPVANLLERIGEDEALARKMISTFCAIRPTGWRESARPCNRKAVLAWPRSHML